MMVSGLDWFVSGPFARVGNRTACLKSYVPTSGPDPVASIRPGPFPVVQPFVDPTMHIARVPGRSRPSLGRPHRGRPKAHLGARCKRSCFAITPENCCHNTRRRIHSYLSTFLVDGVSAGLSF